MLLVVSPSALEGAASAVPEPTAWLLFALGALIILYVVKYTQR